MSQRKENTCPRCGDNRSHYQTKITRDLVISLDNEEKKIIEELYTEELCLPCFIQLKKKFKIINYIDLNL